PCARPAASGHSERCGYRSLVARPDSPVHVVRAAAVPRTLCAIIRQTASGRKHESPGTAVPGRLAGDSNVPLILAFSRRHVLARVEDLVQRLAKAETEPAIDANGAGVL